MKKLLSTLKETVLYIIASAIYLGRLKKLNATLNSLNSKDPLTVLQYDNWKPIKYFVMALVVAFIGGYIIYRKLLIIKDEEAESDDKLGGAISIMLIIVVLVSVLIAINEPILKAIFSVLIIGGFLASCMTQ